MLTVILYALSIIAFCVAAWILPLLTLPVVALTRVNGEIISPTDIRFLAPFVTSAIVLLYITGAVWSQCGYSMGWLFPTIILVLHFVMGSARGANLANQAQAFGVVFGVMIYGALSLF